jgi:hypothetical protein
MSVPASDGTAPAVTLSLAAHVSILSKELILQLSCIATCNIMLFFQVKNKQHVDSKCLCFIFEFGADVNTTFTQLFSLSLPCSTQLFSLLPSL